MENQSDYRVLDLKLYVSCGVHSLRKQDVHIHMLVEMRYPLTAPTIIDMLNRKLQANHWNEMCYQLPKLLTKQHKELMIVGIKILHDDLEVTVAKFQEDIDQDSAHMVAASKVPMLKPGVETTIALITTKEKAQRRLELKARSTLLMGIPNEHQLKFTPSKMPSHYCRLLRRGLEGILQLKRLRLEIHGKRISQEDVNQKFLRSLSPEWNTHTIVWRNKPEIDTLSLDDLYNNLKIYEPEETFMPPKPNLSFSSLEEFTSEPIVIKPIVENSEAKASEAKPKAITKNNGAPLIEDWVSDSEVEDVPQAKIEKNS
ncbi:hypothetical protein Tco_1136430 [Tanacetum coccineum]